MHERNGSWDKLWYKLLWQRWKYSRPVATLWRIQVYGEPRCLVGRALHSRLKGCVFEYLQKQWEKFLLQSELSVLTLPQCPFHHMLLQWHLKDPGHSAKSAGGRLHLNMYTTLTQWNHNGLTMLSRHCVGTYQGNKLTCNSSGNIRPQSSQLTEPLWIDLGLKTGSGVCELISTLKKKK